MTMLMLVPCLMEKLSYWYDSLIEWWMGDVDEDDNVDDDGDGWQVCLVEICKKV